MSVANATLLCPAGHLPLKGGDRMGAMTSPKRSPAHMAKSSRSATVMPLVISPLEGEMPGRAEGGDLAAPSAFSHKETLHVPRS